MEYYSAIKSEIMPLAATLMNLEIIILSEVSQTEKDKYDIVYMWNLKKMVQMNLFTKKRVTDVENLQLPGGMEGREKLGALD